SDDQGRSWKHVATVGPAERRFSFQALRDGWHYFSVRTQDNEGKIYPGQHEQVAPGLRVLVDTLPPTVGVRQVQAADVAGAVQRQANDENLDPNGLRLDYRLPGRSDWLPLLAPRQASGTHSWSPGTNAPFEVRLQARDVAGNVAERIVPVTPGPGARPPRAGGADPRPAQR